MVAGEVGDGGPVRVGHVGRERRSAATVVLGQGTEHGVAGQSLVPGWHGQPVTALVPDGLQCGQLQAPDPVPVDAALPVQRPSGRGGTGHGVLGQFRPGDVLDPEVER